MKKPTRQTTIRMDVELLEKLQYIADYDGRTMNGMINAIIKRYVVSFENQHGEIQLPEDDKE